MVMYIIEYVTLIFFRANCVVKLEYIQIFSYHLISTQTHYFNPSKQRQFQNLNEVSLQSVISVFKDFLCWGFISQGYKKMKIYSIPLA